LLLFFQQVTTEKGIHHQVQNYRLTWFFAPIPHNLAATILRVKELIKAAVCSVDWSRYGNIEQQIEHFDISEKK
jgi:hypothetical protein